MLANPDLQLILEVDFTGKEEGIKKAQFSMHQIEAILNYSQPRGESFEGNCHHIPVNCTVHIETTQRLSFELTGLSRPVPSNPSWWSVVVDR